MYIYIYWLIEHLIIAYVGKKTFKNWFEESKEKRKKPILVTTVKYYKLNY